MNIRRLCFVFMFLAMTVAVFAYGGPWEADCLGHGFEKRYVNQGVTYDGPVRSTIVRLLAPKAPGRAVLYIHGFNDYFFQADMARRFVDHGYDFYAVDLRRYGRSLLPGQKRCQVRSLNEYFADVDSALAQVKADGNREVVLMGHSTGGLVASYYLARNPHAAVDALVLNSPFLDWNLGNTEWLVGLVSALGRWFPEIPVPQGDGTGYGESLLRGHHGEWDFNTDWKVLGETKVDAGWVRAINLAQNYLHEHPGVIKVPVLLMFSSRSIDSDDWIPGLQTADAVLDVKDIRSYGSRLGDDVTSVVVPDGMHDLVLSKPAVRNALYVYMFRWLNRQLPQMSAGSRQ